MNVAPKLTPLRAVEDTVVIIVKPGSAPKVQIIPPASYYLQKYNSNYPLLLDSDITYVGP